MKKVKQNGLISGIIFIISAVVSLISIIIEYNQMISFSFSFFKIYASYFFQMYWLSLISIFLLILIGVSLIIDNLSFFKVSIILTAVFSIFSIVGTIMAYASVYSTSNLKSLGLRLIISSSLAFVTYLLACIASFNSGKNLSKILCLIACGVYVISCLLSNSYLGIIQAVAFVFAGFYLENKNSDKVTSYNPEANRSNIEKVSNLKSLLDKGIITEEEFEEKKKQLIGL